MRKYTRTTENKDDYHVSVPFKLLGIADALIYNFAWISPENLFDEASKPTKENKDGSIPYITEIDCLCENLIKDVRKVMLFMKMMMILILKKLDIWHCA